MFSHFLRKLRYEVQSSNGKVFLVTSTQVNAGKSFLILSLAYAMSLVQAKVLIIDTNFRRNALTKALLPRMDSRRLLKKGIDDDDDDDLMLEENNFDDVTMMMIDYLGIPPCKNESGRKGSDQNSYQ